MATVTENPEPVAEFDDFIDDRLDRTSFHLKTLDCVTGLIWLGLFVFGSLFALVLIDHWIVGLGFWARAISLITIFGIGVYLMVSRVLLPLVRSINPEYAALTVEQSHPEFKNGLINFLFFRNRREQLRDGVYQGIREQAAVELGTVPIDSAVDRTPIIKLGYYFIALAAVWVAYILLSPKSPIQTVQRIAMPWQDISRPSQVDILDVTPGSVEIFRGQTVEVTAKIEGLKNDQTAAIEFATLDGQLVDQQIPLTSESGRVFSATITTSGQGIQQDLEYRIRAGDALSQLYEVHVTEAPHIVVDRLEFDYPAYVGIADEVVQGEGDIRAIEGTRVTVFGKANQPIKRGHIEFVTTAESNSPTAKNAPLRTGTDESSGNVKFSLRMDETGKESLYRAYRLHFTNEDNQTSVDAIEHTIEVIPDLRPVVQILSPDKRTIELPENSWTKIELRAVDPDFQLSGVQLAARTRSRKLFREKMLSTSRSSEWHTGQFTATYKFVPRDFGLKAGDVVEYVALAEDNKHAVGQNKLAPNRTITAKQYIRIVKADPLAAKPPKDNEQQSPDADNSKQPQEQQQQQENGGEGEKGNESQSSDSSKGESGEQKGQENGEQQEGEQTGEQQQEGSEGSETGEQQEEGGEGEQQGSESGLQQSGESGGEGEQQSEGGTPGESNDSNTEQSPGNAGNQSSESQGGDPSDSQNAGDQPSENDSNSGEQNGDPSGEQNGSGDQRNGAEENSGRGAREDEPLPSSGERDGEVVERIREHMEKNGDLEEYEKKQQEEQQNGESGEAGSEGENGEQSEGDPQTGEQGDERQQSPGDGSESQNNNQNGETGEAGSEQNSQNGNETGEAEQGNESSSDNGQQNQGNEGEPGEPGSKQGSEGDQNKKQGESGESGTESQSGQGEQAEGDQQGSEQSSETGEGQNDTSKGDPSQGESPNGDSQEGSSQDDSSSGESTSPNDQGEGSEQQSTGDQQGSEQSGEKSGDQSGEKNSQTKNGEGDQNGSEQNGSEQNQSGENPADNPSQQPSDSQNSDSQSGEQSGEQGSEGQTSDSSKSSPSNKGGQKTGSRSEGVHGDGDQEDASESGDDANLEYAREATDMVLEYLKDQEQAPDQELLDKLGWKQNDVDKFLKRWGQLKEKAKGPAPAAQENKSKLDELLKGMGLEAPDAKLRRAKDRNDKQRDNRNTGRGRKVPADLLDPFRAFQRSLQQTK